MVHKLGKTGSIKECKVHDLLRDLCLREARKEGFYTVYPGKDIKDEVDRVVITGTIPEFEGVDALSSAALLARSMIFDPYNSEPPPQIFKLMRIGDFNFTHNKFVDNVHQFVNLRFSRFILKDTELIPSLVFRFWNLQILLVSRYGYRGITVPSDIWHMSHIRHLYLNSLHLPDPPDVQANGIVLANLQTLGKLTDFKCSEQMVKTIPNVRKLHVAYDDATDDRYCLTNLDSLDKLDFLNCTFIESMCLINYPKSLKKLTLRVDSSIDWQEILDKIGDLPLLQKLKLFIGTFKEGEWVTTEGQFRSLKFLSLEECTDLKVWTSEASHFPRLEQLHLDFQYDLEEIPSDFAEMSTLEQIHLNSCSDSAIESAGRILEEQEALYGEEDTTLQVYVVLSKRNNPAMVESFRSPSFHVAMTN